MKASNLVKSLKALIDQKVPTFLWGAPGIGKSSIVRQIADEKGLSKDILHKMKSGWKNQLKRLKQ